MKFVKMHGLGNDYIYVNCLKEKIENPAGLSRKVSDRHFGIGSDGLILIEPSKKADVAMRIFNADGSEAQMCGNGIRCIGKYVYDRKIIKKDRLQIETKGGIVKLQLFAENGKVGEVEVNMGLPHPVPKDFYTKANGKSVLVKDRIKIINSFYDINVISMGNPHCATFVKNVEDYPAFELVAFNIQTHKNFPQQTNVEFVEIIDEKTVRQRTLERGSGETLACGSGACAVMAALYLNKKSCSQVDILLKGGKLKLRYEKGGIYMRGAAVEVFEGELNI